MKNNLSLLRKSLITALFCVLSTVLVLAFAACSNGNGGNEEEEGGDDGNNVAAALSSGTYWGTYSSVSQMGTTNYVIYFTLDADEETYYYECHYVIAFGTPATYYYTENGTYTDDGENLALTPAGAESNLTATISEDGFTLTRALTKMSSKEYEVTYTKGNAPVYVAYKVDNTEYAKIGYKEATDEVVSVAAPTIYGCVFNEWVNVPETAGTGATVQADYTNGDVYAVDVTWMASAGASMSMSPVLVIGSDNKFGIYNGADRGVCKGWGTVSEEDGVYTLTYNDTFANHKDQTTTYTISENTITFTSKLFYGVASLNRTDPDTEEFISYDATLVVD